MLSIVIQQVFHHPDGVVVIVPVDPAVPSFFVKPEQLAGRKPEPGQTWELPDDEQP